MLTRMALSTAVFTTAAFLAVSGIPAATAATTATTVAAGRVPSAVVAAGTVGGPAVSGVLLVAPRYAMEAWVGAGIAAFGAAALLLRPARRRNAV